MGKSYQCIQSYGPSFMTKFCSALYLENLFRNIFAKLNLRGGVSCMPAALLFLVYDIIEFAGRILNVPQCYIRATNFHKDNLWVLLLLRSQNLSYWNLNLFLDYFVIFNSGLGHSAILKQTLILGIRN